MRSTYGHVRTFGGTTQYRVIFVEGKHVLEHRVVMSRFLGRALLTTEIVHHRDGDGLNNEISNLELITQRVHRRYHGGPRQWDLVRALKMRERGMTITAIASYFGVAQPTVSKGLKRRGYVTQTLRKRRFNRDEMLTLFKEGVSQKEIARRLGVKAPSIRKALCKLGYLD